MGGMDCSTTVQREMISYSIYVESKVCSIVVYKSINGR